MALNNFTAYNYGGLGLSAYNRARTLNNAKKSNSTDNNFNKTIPEISSHRGCTKNNIPGNTIESIEQAKKAGYNNVEIDVSFTKDGVPVLYHDDLVSTAYNYTLGKRYDNSVGISTKTYDEIQNIRLKDKYKIPTLESAIKKCKELGLSVHLEIKEGDDFNKKQAQKIANIINSNNMQNNISFISFNQNSLKTMSEVMPRASLGYLDWGILNNNEKTLHILQELDNGTNKVFLDRKFGKCTKETVDFLKANGYTTEAWLSKEEGTSNAIKKAANMGISGLTSDNLTPPITLDIVA